MRRGRTTILPWLGGLDSRGARNDACDRAGARSRGRTYSGRERTSCFETDTILRSTRVSCCASGPRLEQRFKLAADAIRNSLRATLDYGQSSYPDALGSLDVNKVVDLIVREWASLQARRGYAPVEGDKTT